MKIKKQCHQAFLGMILIALIIPSFCINDNQSSSYNTYQMDTTLLNELDLTRIYNITEHLSSYKTRMTGTLESNLAASYIHSMLNETYNLTDIFYEDFIYNETICSNLVARINGSNLKDELIIISAHYDSISTLGDAPGANDNAVAVAVCMEIMGIIQNNMILNRTLLFVSFSGEEQAFIGSQAWIHQHKAELSQIVAVINLDMIGYGDRLSIIKNDQSEWLADAVISASSAINVTFTKSNSLYPETARFDHDTFWLAQVPCVTLFEAGAIYPHYHTSQDTIDKISFHLVEKCAQVTLLSIFYLGTIKFQHNLLISSLIIWVSWALAAILPLLIYKKRR
ncbi:MAG: M28 family metallopeptidase [Promethearchaeota archaeon]